MSPAVALSSVLENLGMEVLKNLNSARNKTMHIYRIIEAHTQIIVYMEKQ
jgi:hypothetical protein